MRTNNRTQPQDNRLAAKLRRQDDEALVVVVRRGLDLLGGLLWELAKERVRIKVRQGETRDLYLCHHTMF